MTVKELVNILQMIINQDADVMINDELYIQQLVIEVDRHGKETGVSIDAA